MLFKTISTTPDSHSYLEEVQQKRLVSIKESLSAMGVRVLALRDVSGMGLILYWIGDGMEYEVEGRGEADVAEEMLSDLPDAPGLWVWEGKLCSNSYNSIDHGYDYDTEFNGEWRALNEDEKGLLEECPYDVAEIWQDWSTLTGEKTALEWEAQAKAKAAQESS